MSLCLLIVIYSGFFAVKIADEKMAKLAFSATENEIIIIIIINVFVKLHIIYHAHKKNISN